MKKIKKLIIVATILLVIIGVVQVMCPLYTIDMEIEINEMDMYVLQYLEEQYESGVMEAEGDVQKLNYLEGLPSDKQEDYVDVVLRGKFQNVSISKILDASYIYKNESKYADRVVFAESINITKNNFKRFGKCNVAYSIVIYKNGLSDEQIEDIITNVELTLVYETEMFGSKEKKLTFEDYKYEK